jgi:hypothetical protein
VFDTCDLASETARGGGCTAPQPSRALSAATADRRSPIRSRLASTGAVCPGARPPACFRAPGWARGSSDNLSTPFARLPRDPAR